MLEALARNPGTLRTFSSSAAASLSTRHKKEQLGLMCLLWDDTTGTSFSCNGQPAHWGLSNVYAIVRPAMMPLHVVLRA